jgi:peptidoglycan/LPS O-acetylase OafA/YrhL
MVMGLWYRQNRAWMDERLFSFAALIAGVAIYAAGLYSYAWSFAYTLTDGLIGTGLFVILAQIAYQSRRLRWLEAAITYVGVYSYGLYLLHQPYVIYLGIRMRALSASGFFVAACLIVAAFALVSTQVERYVNHLSDRFLSRTSDNSRPQPS